MIKEITLKWDGPFSLASSELIAKFKPPKEPGVYLWIVGAAEQYQISYIGETANLWDRIYAHSTSMLGGAYYLYSDDHLIHRKDPNEHVKYKPGFCNLLTKFLSEYPNYSLVAHRNLTLYKWFWAVLSEEKEIREAVESALIDAAQKENVPVQNDRPSRGSHKARHVKISSALPPGVQVRGLRSFCEYGEID